MKQSMESNFFKKFTAIASLPSAHTLLMFQIFFFKNLFLRKSSKPGHGNLVLYNFNCSSWTFKVKRQPWWCKNLFSSSWQITFVTVNGFCPLSNPFPMFLTDNNKMDRILTKRFYIVSQVLKVLLIKICKIESLDLLFLVVFISFYISWYHFSEVFRTYSRLYIWKKDFRHKFSFFSGFNPSHPPAYLRAKICFAWQKFFVNAP